MTRTLFNCQKGVRLFLDVAAANLNVSCSCARLCTTLIHDIQQDTFSDPTILNATPIPRER